MTIEAAPQPSNFTATFTIKVNGLRTTTIDNMQNVVKQVDWTMIGEESNQKFELPQTTILIDPIIDNFKSLAQVTEQDVISWIEVNETRLPSIKAHIQFVLDKLIAESILEETAMPWAPIPIIETEPQMPPPQPN